MMPGIRPPDQTEAQRLATKAEDAKRTAKDSAGDGEIKPNDNILVFVNRWTETPMSAHPLTYSLSAHAHTNTNANTHVCAHALCALDF